MAIIGVIHDCVHAGSHLSYVQTPVFSISLQEAPSGQLKSPFGPQINAQSVGGTAHVLSEQLWHSHKLKLETETHSSGLHGLKMLPTVWHWSSFHRFFFASLQFFPGKKSRVSGYRVSGYQGISAKYHDRVRITVGQSKLDQSVET